MGTPTVGSSTGISSSEKINAFSRALTASHLNAKGILAGLLSVVGTIPTCLVLLAKYTSIKQAYHNEIQQLGIQRFQISEAAKLPEGGRFPIGHARSIVFKAPVTDERILTDEEATAYARDIGVTAIEIHTDNSTVYNPKATKFIVGGAFEQRAIPGHLLEIAKNPAQALQQYYDNAVPEGVFQQANYVQIMEAYAKID